MICADKFYGKYIQLMLLCVHQASYLTQLYEKVCTNMEIRGRRKKGVIPFSVYNM